MAVHHHKSLLTTMRTVEVMHVGRGVEVAIGLVAEDLERIAEAMIAAGQGWQGRRCRTAGNDLMRWAAKAAAVRSELAGRLGQEARAARATDEAKDFEREPRRRRPARLRQGYGGQARNGEGYGGRRRKGRRR